MIVKYVSGKIEAILSKTKKLIVEGVSFCLDEGQSLAIIGETGSGKTTLAYSIMNTLPPNMVCSGLSFEFEGKQVKNKKRNPKTFENFDFARISGKNVDKLRSICTLSAIYAHKNLAFIGKTGTGKTHLAQAFGYECCKQGMKVYFIKMSELRDKFTAARRAGKEASVLNGLVRPSCLIIDEVGHCEFDKENTRLFFDLIDRRYNKEGNFNIVFTSNKHPSHWRSNFNEDDALLCALDRIFDDATVFTIKGESFRGKKLETVALQTSRVKAPASSEKPTP